MHSGPWQQRAIFIAFFKRGLSRRQFLILVGTAIGDQAILQTLHQLKEIFKVYLAIGVVRCAGLNIKTLDKVDSFSGITTQRTHDSLQVRDFNETRLFFVKHLEDAAEVFDLLLGILLEYCFLLTTVLLVHYIDLR